jgi:hypothetical protein
MSMQGSRFQKIIIIIIIIIAINSYFKQAYSSYFM